MGTDAAIRVRCYIFSEETLQIDQVTLSRRANKSFKKAPVLVRTDGRASTICDMFAGTRDDLAGVSFLHVQDLRDLAVRVIESFTQDVSRTFCGRESLEQEQDRKLQCLSAFRTYYRIAAHVDRFGKPSVDIGFATCMSGLGEVYTQSCGCRGEKRGRVFNNTPIRRLPAQPHFLY